MEPLTDDEKGKATDVYFLPRGADLGGGASSEEEIEWQKFVDEMGEAVEHAKICAYREPTGPDGQPKGKGYVYLFDCSVDAYSFSQLCGRLRDDYGSGVYRIQLRDRGGVLRKNQRVMIEAPKNQDVSRPSNNAGDVIAQMSLAMENQQRRFEAVMERYNRPQESSMDQLAGLMAGFSQIMKNLGVAPGERERPKSTVEVLTELKLQRDLMGDLFGDDRGGNIDSMWGAIAKAAESFGAPLMQALAAAQRRGQLSPDGVVQPRRLAHQENPEPERPDPENMELIEKLKFLCKQAENRVSPADVAAFVVENLPDDDETVNGLYDFLADPECLQSCAAAWGPVSDHEQWFADWRRIMLSMLDKLFASDDDPLTDTPPAPDHTGTGAGAAGTENDATAAKPGNSVDADGNTERPGGGSGNA